MHYDCIAERLAGIARRFGWPARYVNVPRQPATESRTAVVQVMNFGNIFLGLAGPFYFNSMQAMHLQRYSLKAG